MFTRLILALLGLVLLAAAPPPDDTQVWVESSSCTGITIGYYGFTADPQTPGFLWINTAHGTRGVDLHMTPGLSSISGFMFGSIDSTLTCDGPAYIAMAEILGYNGSIVYDLQGEPVSCYLVRLPILRR